MSLDAQRTLVDYQSTAGPMLVQVRGSLLVSSLQSLRELDYFPRYIAHLPVAFHEPVLYALASTWLPSELAVAHYAACDEMELSEQEFERVGEYMAKRMFGTLFATVLRSSRLVGANVGPLATLRNYDRLWERLLQGGSCTVCQTGPKDVSIESRGVPMFRYRYFRFAYMNLIRGAGLLFGRTVYTRVLRSSDTALKLNFSWV
jgi:hypothetical protein